MKDSGIEWIGTIPNHWSIIKLKKYSKIRSGDYVSKDDYVENGIFEIIGSNGKIGEYSKKNLNKECVVIGRVGAVGSLRICNNCWVTDNALIIEQNNNLNVKFLFYCLANVDFLAFNTGTAQPLMTGTQLSNTRIPNIIIEDQQRIADFLDRKCGLINTAIENQKKSIEKLKEYKQSLITELVTGKVKVENGELKERHPSEMKDSGIEWIGEIPKDWDTVPLFVYYKERKCKNIKGIENNLLSLSYGNIVRKNIEDNNGLLPESFDTYNIIECENIVLRLTDLQNDKRSLRCGFAKERGIITSAYVTIENINQINNYYIFRLLHTYDIMKVFYNLGGGVRQGLKYDELKKLPIIIPSNLEQEQIVDFLDKKCLEIEKVIKKKQRIIDRLNDYKKSLIYEAVTGKMEVL